MSNNKFIEAFKNGKLTNGIKSNITKVTYHQGYDALNVDRRYLDIYVNHQYDYTVNAETGYYDECGKLDIINNPELFIKTFSDTAKEWAEECYSESESESDFYNQHRKL